MTMQQKVLIELKDILSIEYTCKHCRSTYLVPIDRFDRIIHECPNCKEGIIANTAPMDEKPGVDTTLLGFVRLLGDLKKLGIPIRLEISAIREGA